MAIDFTPITGVNRDGDRVWYTGRAGEGYVSPDYRNAYNGYGLEGAQRRATVLNRMTPMTGIHFVAVTGDLLYLFATPETATHAEMVEEMERSR